MARPTRRTPTGGGDPSNASWSGDDLERRLIELGRRVDAPSPGTLVSSVTQRIAAGQQPRPWWRSILDVRERRALRPVWMPMRQQAAVAVAIVVVVIGGILAVPATRDTVAGLLGLGGVQIQQVPELPPVQGPADLRSRLGERVTLATARSSERFRIVLPATLGEPYEVYLSGRYPGGVVSLLWNARPELPTASVIDAGLLLTEFAGSINSRTMVAKLLDRGGTVESVTVAGEPAYWISGRPHEVVLVDENGEYVFETLRLEGDVLLWAHEGVTFRIESGLSRDAAIRIAESIR